MCVAFPPEKFKTKSSGMIALPPDLSIFSTTFTSPFLPQTIIHGLVLLGSFLMYFVVSLVYNATCVNCNSPTNPYWVMERQLSDPTFYLVCFLTPVMALLPRFEHRGCFLPRITSAPFISHFQKPRVRSLTPAGNLEAIVLKTEY